MIPFAKSQDIRAYAGVLEPEHLTGSAEAGNHLIQNEQDTIAIADFTHALQVAVRGMKNAAASDRRFKNDGSNGIRAFHSDHAFELVRAARVQPPRRHKTSSGSGPAELHAGTRGRAARSSLARRLSRRGERPHSKAVVRTVTRDNFVAVLPGVLSPCILPGHLERSLHCLRAAIQEENTTKLRREQACQAPSQLRPRRMRLGEWVVRQQRHLLGTASTISRRP